MKKRIPTAKMKRKQKIKIKPVKRIKKIISDATGIQPAAEKTGLSEEFIRVLKAKGTPAFKSSGRINCDQLLIDAAKFSDLAEELQDMPNIKLEKALRERVKRRNDELNFEVALKNVASLDVCRRILIRGGKFALSKLMSIPDRVHERFALETDALKIRESLILEITDALRELSETNVEKLIEEILKD